jgi:hypothetical protein
LILRCKNSKKIRVANYNFILPASRVTKVAKATTDTELMGIRIAATTGDRFPVMANAIPIML